MTASDGVCPDWMLQIMMIEREKATLREKADDQTKVAKALRAEAEALESANEALHAMNRNLSTRIQTLESRAGRIAYLAQRLEQAPWAMPGSFPGPLVHNLAPTVGVESLGHPLTEQTAYPRGVEALGCSLPQQSADLCNLAASIPASASAPSTMSLKPLQPSSAPQQENVGAASSTTAMKQLELQPKQSKDDDRAGSKTSSARNRMMNPLPPLDHKPVAP